MNEEYTPTTEAVKRLYATFARTGKSDKYSVLSAEFDRWLAAHDKRVADVAAQNAALRIALGEAMMR